MLLPAENIKANKKSVGEIDGNRKRIKLDPFPFSIAYHFKKNIIIHYIECFLVFITINVSANLLCKRSVLII